MTGIDPVVIVNELGGYKLPWHCREFTLSSGVFGQVKDADGSILATYRVELAGQEDGRRDSKLWHGICDAVNLRAAAAPDALALMGATGLTRFQAQVLHYIEEFRASQGVSPTYQEIADALGLKAKSRAHAAVQSLAERGRIRFSPAHARSIVVTVPLTTEERRSCPPLPPL